MRQSPKWWRQTLFATLLIGLAGFVLFARALSIGYLSDDFDLFRALVSSDFSIFDAFPAGRGTYFRPLVMLTLMIEHDWSATGSAWIHHLTNVLIHVCSSFLVYFIGWTISRRWVLSLGLGLLFLVHPANVTDVYWIAGRTDSLSTLFSLVCVLGFIKFLYTDRWAWLLVSGGGLAGGLLSKESAAILAFVLLAIAVLLCEQGRRSQRGVQQVPLPNPKESTSHPRPSACRIRRILLVLSPFFLFTAGYLLYLYLRFYRPSEMGLPAPSFRQALETLLKSLVLLVLPVRPSLAARIYGSNPWLLVLGIGAFAVGVVIAGIWLWRRGRTGRRFFGGLLILLLAPLLPTIWLGGTSSRLMYLPIAILCIVLAVLAGAFPAAGRRFPYTIYPLAVLMAVFSWQQGTIWLQNWNLTRSYCHSFRGIMAAKPPGSDLIFLTMPYSRRDVPVYANDLDGALYHCLNGKFGAFPRLRWLGPVVVDGPPGTIATVTLGHPGPGAYDLSLTSPATHFLFPPGAQPGTSYESPVARLLIGAVNERGLVTDFTLTFSDPEYVGQGVLLYASDAAFHTVPHGDPPDAP